MKKQPRFVMSLANATNSYLADYLPITKQWNTSAALLD